VIIKRHFHRLLQEQEFLETRAQWSKMLALVPSRTLAADLDKEWQETPATSLSRWGRLKQEIQVRVQYTNINFLC
jgi:chromosome condensin MukBEF MukE localization factor